ncbi:glycoside hydrolase family 47 protein [Xylaria sp. CBS 124048]|nr:glycoside hydrolase family 47 protein [Xylaria sp. CBS 124048]
MVTMIWRNARRALVVLVVISFIYAFYDPLPPRREERLLKIPYSAFVKTSVDWSRFSHKSPVPTTELTPFPRGSPRDMPKLQFHFPIDATSTGRARERVLKERRELVKAAFAKSWRSYKLHAWMSDEVAPVSGIAKDTLGGWAATLIESLDSLWIMDMRDDFYEAATAVAALDWSATEDTSCKFFETTVRHLGGLLSAYDLSKETVLLHKAVELGDMLFMAFDTPTRMPPSWLDFDKAKNGLLQAGTHDPAASVASPSLEFTRLARLTGKDKYYDAIHRVTKLLDQAQASTRLPGIWPTFFDMENLVLDKEREFTLGPLVGPIYELLPKMYALLGGLEPVYEKLYKEAMEAVKKYLLFRPAVPEHADILFSGNALVRDDGSIDLQTDGEHLTCFAGGMFALGGKLLGMADHIEIGEKITRGCVWAYDAMPSGIMPEMFGMRPCPTLEACEWDETRWVSEGNHSLPRGIQHARDPRYLLRPEAIESVFLMYRITGKEEYQEMAWRMFLAIQKATETDLAFSAISDVNVDGLNTEKTDSMESFWLSGTLKYFYLVFSPPDLISLDEYIFNTEAHPLRRP